MTVAVPAWPIIHLRWEGEILHVEDSAATLPPRRVLPLPGEEPFETARRSAVKACQALGMDRARVQGVDGDETVSLIVDAGQESLTEVQVPAAAGMTTSKATDALKVAHEKAGRGRFSAVLVPTISAVSSLNRSAVRARSWAKTKKGRKILAGSFVAVMVLGTGTFVAGRQAGWFTPEQHQVQAVPVAPAGQLPVYAPAGWQTYASWTLPVPRGNTVPVLSPDRHAVIMAGDNKLRAVDSGTGAELWSKASQGSMSGMTVMAVDGEQQIVVKDGSKVRLYGFDGAAGPVYDSGAKTLAKLVTDSGREPYFALEDQRVMVISQGALSLRRIPAGAVVVGVDRGTVLAVELSTARLWRITDSSVKFPAPVKIPAPAGAATLSAVVPAPDGSLVTVWKGTPVKSGKQMVAGKSVVAVYPAFPQLGAASTVAVFAPNDVSPSRPVLDRYTGTMLLGKVLVNPAAHIALDTPDSNGKLGAGFWWGTGAGQKPVRLSPTGQSVSSAADAPVPLFVLPNNRVLVEAGTDKAIYALTPEGEKK